MEGLSRDGILYGLGVIIAAIGVAYKAWKKEEKTETEAQKAAANLTPQVMQGLFAAGTPMSALAVDTANNLHLAVEKNGLKMDQLSDIVVAMDRKFDALRQEIREDRIRDDAYRQGERDRQDRRDRDRDR